MTADPHQSDEQTRTASATYLPAAHYSYDQLAELYNQARTDYIVPMPMNGRRMAEYVRMYDVRLDESLIARDPSGADAGICMMGVRDRRVWVTRLGIIPERRGLHIGRDLTLALLDRGRALRATHVQLEVIEGNAPAHRLFISLGFVERRGLLVIRRPPAPSPGLDPAIGVIPLSDEVIAVCLGSRRDVPSWIDESASLLNGGGLVGWQIGTPDGRTGWIVARASAFQLSHIVFDSPDVQFTGLLLATLHSQAPRLDTNLENLPVDHPHWAAFQGLGYVESFRRIEMLMRL
ncbi:MAG: GNAT family N-acetyltransferase [Chloroflexota bacterium]|nr:GNAT family N-acetyltransferase [Chloroflexota bacterium]